MYLNIYDFINLFDLSFLMISLISIYFGVKNGFTKSFLNLLKWIAIFFIIKSSFTFMRPIIDPYLTNEILADIFIFISVFITSYILISIIIRIMVAIFQPNKIGILDLGFGIFLGLGRGYIIMVLLIFFINNSFSQDIFLTLFKNGEFKDLITLGLNFLKQMPREI